MKKKVYREFLSDEEETKATIAAMKRAKKKILGSKKSATEFLISIGVLTKSGKPLKGF